MNYFKSEDRLTDVYGDATNNNNCCLVLLKTPVNLVVDPDILVFLDKYG